MRTSRKTMSGCKRAMSWSAASPVAHSPTSSTSLCRCSSVRSFWRASRSSSTISVRIFMGVSPRQFQGDHGAALGARLEAQLVGLAVELGEAVAGVGEADVLAGRRLVVGGDERSIVADTYAQAIVLARRLQRHAPAPPAGGRARAA